MLLVYPLAAQKIVGTDLFHAAALLWVAGSSHLAHGNVDLHAMAWLLVGSIPGVLLGSNMSIRLPDRALRIAFATILFLSELKLAGLPHATVVIAVAAACGAVALVGWCTRLYVRRLHPPATEPQTPNGRTTRSGGRVSENGGLHVEVPATRARTVFAPAGALNRPAKTPARLVRTRRTRLLRAPLPAT